MKYYNQLYNYTYFSYKKVKLGIQKIYKNFYLHCKKEYKQVKMMKT